MVNVTDIVFLVGNIINGAASNNDTSSLATDAIIKIASNQLLVEGINGEISGIQLILNHGYDFEIILDNTDMANLEFSGVRKLIKIQQKYLLLRIILRE